MKKRISKRKVQINLSNRLLYTFITLGILTIVAVGVYALGSVPSPVGHAISELQTCDTDDQVLKMSGGVWVCGSATATETDPTVLASVKDGVSWSELTGVPAGFADGVDNEGSGTTSCPSGYTQYNSLCIKLSDDHIYWNDATRACATEGAHLCSLAEVTSTDADICPSGNEYWTSSITADDYRTLTFRTYGGPAGYKCSGSNGRLPNNNRGYICCKELP